MDPRRVVAGLVVAGTVTMATACGDRPAESPGTTGASAGSVVVSAGPSTTSPSPVPTVMVPATGTYVAGTARRTGTEGPVTFDVGVPTVSGGSPAVSERFNSSMRASLAPQLKLPDRLSGTMTVKDGSLPDGRRSGVTELGPGVVAGVLLTNTYISGGAHATTVIGTVVIATATAEPVLLTDLFATPDSGLQQLAALVKQHAAALGTVPFLSDPARDMANWIPGSDGLTVFAGVTHAEGDYRAVTVPWAELKDFIAPAMWPVLTA